MKKFMYKMESVLQIKFKLEDQAKIAYGNARHRLSIEEEKLQKLVNQKSSYEDEMKILRLDRLDLFKIHQCTQAIDIMKINIKQQTTTVKNADHRLEVARIRLHNAMVERKTHEKLKEKAFEEYLLEFDSEERKEIDELNSFHYSNPALQKEDI